VTVVAMSPDRLVLLDGRSVLVRALRAEDRELDRAAVAGLSARSRYLRFAAPLPKMSNSLLSQMMAFDGGRHVAYAALTPDEAAIVGVGRFVRPCDQAGEAEVAIGIADAWQGAGLGSGLLCRLIAHARQTDLGRLTAITLSENRAAGHLACAAGFSLSRYDGIYTEYELPLVA